MKYENRYEAISGMYQPLLAQVQQAKNMEAQNGSLLKEKDDLDMNAAFGILREKNNLIRDSVLEIKLQIEERKNLSNVVKEALDRLLWKNKERLLQLDRLMGANNPVTFERRSEIEKDMNRMEELKLTSEIQLWSDVTALQNELREALREQSESIKAEFLE